MRHTQREIENRECGNVTSVSLTRLCGVTSGLTQVHPPRHITLTSECEGERVCVRARASPYPSSHLPILPQIYT